LRKLVPTEGREAGDEVIIKKRRSIKKRFFEVMRARERLD